MKEIFLGLCILIQFSCNQDSTQKIETAKHEDTISDNSDIYGDWKMCSNGDESNMIQRNVCPTISFNVLGTATVKMNDETTETFSWQLKKEKITITHSKQNAANNFADTTYLTVIEKVNESFEMKIFTETGSHIYYLSK